MIDKAMIERLATIHYQDGFENTQEQLFAFLVDVADVYLQTIEAAMPSDQAGSPFLGGMMPIEVVIEGLAENLEMRQDEGRRVA